MTMNLEQIYQRWEQKTLARGHRLGKAEGKAKAVIAVLDARGLPITPTQRAQMLTCADPQKLDAWLRAALTTESVAVLLEASRPRQPRATRRR